MTTSAPTENQPAAPTRRRWRPTLGRFLACLSLLGLGCLCYVAGAATMYFRLPTSRSLAEAFAGAEIWSTRENPPDAEPGAWGEPQLHVDRSGSACDGFTLYLTTDSAEARLIDMRGEVVHRWTMPARKDWPRKDGVPQPGEKEFVHWERCHLFPNGDLLVLCSVGDHSPYGYALLKLDRNSELLWGYSEKVHHDVTVDEDGRVYVLVHEVTSHPP